MRLAALVVLLSACVLVVTVGLSFFSRTVSDPLEPREQVVATLLAVVSLVVVLSALLQGRRVRAGDEARGPLAPIAAAARPLVVVGVATGVVVLLYLAWVYMHARR